MEGPRGFQHPHHNLPDNAHGVSTRTARARRHLVNIRENISKNIRKISFMFYIFNQFKFYSCCIYHTFTILVILQLCLNYKKEKKKEIIACTVYEK